jgi:predicted lipase
MGEPYAGLSFTAYDSQGQVYNGETDSEGYTKFEDFYLGPLFLEINGPFEIGEKWYEDLRDRKSFPIPLTAIQVAAEQTPAAHRKPGDPHLPQLRAQEEEALYYHVQVRDFVPTSAAAHLPEHKIDKHLPSPFLVAECKALLAKRGIAEKAGIPLAPCRHHVIEIKALRAYSPIFSRDKDFCALNCYHLAVMGTFAYAPFNQERAWDERPTPPPYLGDQIASIGRVLHNELAHLKRPTLFNDAGPYHLLCEEVPYSKRLEVVPWDDVRYAKENEEGWEFPEDVHFLHNDSDTQAFITHNDKVVLISIRGTAGNSDVLRDLDARQIPYGDGPGQAHRGFLGAFSSAKEFIDRYLESFHTNEQTILVVGHSLGGAIALLVAEWLRRWAKNPDVILYTFGAPRTVDATFVREAKDLTHHRMVNHNDPIPGIPFTWMDSEWKTLIPSAVLASSVGPTKYVGIGGVLASLVNMEGDNYEHHGEQRHFIPRKPGAGSEAKVLWQPGCATVEKQVCALYAAHLQLKGDMPKRVSFGETVMSIKQHFGDHSSHTGYAHAALANLLRWRASVVERGGSLFSVKESEQLIEQVRDIEAELKVWVPSTYAEFYTRVRTLNDPRFKGMTQLELQALFNDARSRLVNLAVTEQKELKRTRKRLQAQAAKAISWKDVFGDQADRQDLDALLAEWLKLADIQKAARLAKVSAGSTSHIA